MENTKIAWCDNTFNPWIGCTKVSPGCDNCYAETQDRRFRPHNSRWGAGVPRARTSTKNWAQPLKWDKEADSNIDAALHDFGEDRFVPPPRPRVFCGSLCDWLDAEAPIEWLADLLELIGKTPNLDWLLLTKRPENFKERLLAAVATNWADPADLTDRVHAWVSGEREPPNVWLGTTVENQEMADKRIPELLQIPARVRFLSCEPLLGAVDLRPPVGIGVGVYYGIHWVICGGESGPKARPMHSVWARSLHDQCAAAGIPFLFKQWGGARAGGDRIFDGAIHDGYPEILAHWQRTENDG